MKTMKTFKIFSTAALALMMAACSSEDAALNNSPAQQQGRKVHFTATIAAPGGNAGTRTEYTEVTTGDAAGTINVVWKAGDEIALIHNGVKDVATVKTVNTDGSATITGDITVGTDGEAIEVCYPAAAWEWYAEKSCAIRNETFVTNITTKQDGTLKYIQDNLDTRMGKGTLKVDGDKATLSDNVKLASQIAIWKLTLQDDAETPTALSATQVSVKVGGETPVTIASTAKLSTATSTVYLAMDKLEKQYLTIEATVGSDTYKYENEDISLALGQYYQSKVTMEKPWDGNLATVTKNVTVTDGTTIYGTLGKNVMISIADGATVTLDGVTINGENNESYNWAGITCEGDAIIILKGTNTVKGFYDDYPGIHPAVGKTLTIKGTGSLTASSNGYGTGIGGGWSINCGNIIIEGGTITATGGQYAAAIGSGNQGKCGNIEITTDVTKVTATKGASAPNSIGAGYNGTCGMVTIGCTLDNGGNPVGGTPGAISTSPYTYDPNAAAGTTVTWNSSNCSSMNIIGPSNATIADIKLSCNAGRVSASWYGGIEFSARATGGFTFTAPTGKKFTKIEMSFDDMLSGWDNAAMSGNLGTGWPTDIREIASNKKVTWTGTAASTVDLLTGASDFNGAAASSIVFTLVDAE